MSYHQSHPVGRFKEAVFSGMGYTRDDWMRLEADIRGQHLPLEVSGTAPSKFGQKYMISGPITGPIGRIVVFKSVWIVLKGQSAPRLVTIYPESRLP